jgi:hypothetical protein
MPLGNYSGISKRLQSVIFQRIQTLLHGLPVFCQPRHHDAALDDGHNRAREIGGGRVNQCIFTRLLASFFVPQRELPFNIDPPTGVL